ncbi:hypothetical protein [Natronorubrum sulfidifaciens]|uniref:Uncharacterized protein n=1 Tax=Natronorubrum sulfidifaciens JCM 14089 TaxID=1230460 RepID=L9VVY2_9EURY|nr:hypothetical protein [Natronorubrum sulfidifaciens]ELY41176.1 hypothetical protein C495_16805 [Natronorubrum sulfidifaciens JCM 14089]
MRQLMVVFGISSAVTGLTIGLIVTNAFQIGQQEVATENIDAVGEFIVVGLTAIIAIQLLALVSRN